MSAWQINNTEERYNEKESCMRKQVARHLLSIDLREITPAPFVFASSDFSFDFASGHMESGFEEV